MFVFVQLCGTVPAEAKGGMFDLKVSPGGNQTVHFGGTKLRETDLPVEKMTISEIWRTTPRLGEECLI